MIITIIISFVIWNIKFIIEHLLEFTYVFFVYIRLLIKVNLIIIVK